MENKTIIVIGVIAIFIVGIGGYCGYIAYQNNQFEYYFKQATIAEGEAIMNQELALTALKNKDYDNAQIYSFCANQNFTSAANNLAAAAFYAPNSVYKSYIENDISRMQTYSNMSMELMQVGTLDTVNGVNLPKDENHSPNKISSIIAKIPQYKANITKYENNMNQIKNANPEMFINYQITMS